MLAALRDMLVRRWTPPEPDEPDDTLYCIVCCDRPRTRLFQPCMHVCTCDECATRVTACPLCKVDVQARWRVFL